jgi:hypothetical protein
MQQPQELELRVGKFARDPDRYFVIGDKSIVVFKRVRLY